jgi:hypothetical protein
MHSSKNKQKKPATAADASNPTTHNIKNACKGLLLFIVSAVAIGFFYIASQAIAAATAGKTRNTYINVRWWFNVDGIELMFYLAVLWAVLHFVVNAGGGSKIKHWYAFAIAILAISFLLVGVAPDVYQQVRNNTESVKFGRGGCYSVEEADKKFGFMASCPLIPSDGFVRYDFINRTEEEIGVMASGIGVLSSFASAQTLSTTMKKMDDRGRAAELKLESFMKTRCAYAMIDALCAETFREVIRLPRSCFFCSLVVVSLTRPPPLCYFFSFRH